MADKQCLSVSEVATRWSCSEADILRFAVEKKLTLGLWLSNVDVQIGTLDGSGDSLQWTVEAERAFTGFVPLDAATVAKIARGWTWHLSKVADLGNGRRMVVKDSEFQVHRSRLRITPEECGRVERARRLPHGTPKKRRPAFNLSSASQELRAAIACHDALYAKGRLVWTRDHRAQILQWLEQQHPDFSDESRQRIADLVNKRPAAEEG
jgi:hypothetical protein